MISMNSSIKLNSSLMFTPIYEKDTKVIHIHVIFTGYKICKYLFRCSFNFSITLSTYRMQHQYFLSSINGAVADSFVGVREFVRLSDAYARVCRREVSFISWPIQLLLPHELPWQHTDCCVGGVNLFLLNSLCQFSALKLKRRFTRDWKTTRLEKSGKVYILLQP